MTEDGEDGQKLNRWQQFWKNHDPDVVFAYSTMKLVNIHDRFLGIFHYIAMFLIFCYVVLFATLYERGYLKLDAPVGTIRLAVKDPASAPSSASSYCTSSGIPCLYWQANEVSGVDSSGSVFITTGVTITKFNRSCSDENPVCRDDIVSGPTEYLVANVEDMALSIDHAPYTPVLGIKFGEFASGYLQTLEDPNVATSWANSGPPFESMAADQITISTFLTAAHYDLNAVANAYLDTGDDPTFRLLNFRRFGGVIVLMINYENTQGFVSGLELISFQYRPMTIPIFEDFQREVIWTGFPDSRTEIVRRGIRVVGVMTGQLGLFDFQTLLVQLATSLALITTSKLIVDSLAIYVLPRKKLYYEAKYQDTEDFSNMMARLKAEKKALKTSLETSTAIDLSAEQPGEQTGGPGRGIPDDPTGRRTQLP
eukprot:TRINITY_DN18866_c0_g1_i1.p1 TRINITY_DN18866_c0_g1~~TRINITY_DN18866_c0_g1_i1.p1  ORF type:complete len:425 (+),score=79.25 TRINITY_DN18866_c0_g1_i1:127-1401(+)